MFNPKSFYENLLKTWCEALLELQITEIKQNGVYGGIVCPACSVIHGRCTDAIYPFMYMADKTGDKKYSDGAKALFEYSESMSRSDGSFVNDALNDWRCITVFSVMGLGAALIHHGHILDKGTYERWSLRLKHAADFIYDHINFETSNINYPISCSAALATAYKVLGEEKYKEKAKYFSREGLNYLSENNLIYGEGKPKTNITSKGCRPVDIGYNVEESLPSLVHYAILMGDEMVMQKTVDSMKEHLNFMLPDGGWDNSFGSRMEKWTYWGSRTSDGCQSGYGVLGREYPMFAEASLRNAQLMQKCTHNGLLYGGLNYHKAGELPCVHHTFCHAKALAMLLDSGAADVEFERCLLPREMFAGIKNYNELDTVLLSEGNFMATVTAYDWDRKYSYNPSGGSISMLYHKTAGLIFSSSMTEYKIKESLNQQLPINQDRHICLIPRIELEQEGETYFSMADCSAEISCLEKDASIVVTASGILKTLEEKPLKQDGEFSWKYIFEKDKLTVQVTLNGNICGARLVIPVVVSENSKIVRINEKNISVKGAEYKICISAAENIFAILGENKTGYNLVSGAIAYPVSAEIRNGECEFVIEVCVN